MQLMIDYTKMIICRRVILRSRSLILQNCRHLAELPLAHHQPILSVSNLYNLVSSEFQTFKDDIKQELDASCIEFAKLASYGFNTEGKLLRPLITLLMSRACNCHMKHLDRHSSTQYGSTSTRHQRSIAMISEMIHTASLVHDDIVDSSGVRRGKPSVHRMAGEKAAVLVGDFILSRATMLLARIGNPEIIIILAQVVEDLVRGEFMQMLQAEEGDDLFSHYLKKTFKKTASLIANSCKAVAILSGAPDLAESSFEYGRNFGMAFQLIDDMLDFTGDEVEFGKPVAADLKLGIVTAPVLFAARDNSDLQTMMNRKFSNLGDVEKALDYVKQSDGIERTRLLAQEHVTLAVDSIAQLHQSEFKNALELLANHVLTRTR